jgi:hypothetical protein
MIKVQSTIKTPVHNCDGDSSNQVQTHDCSVYGKDFEPLSVPLTEHKYGPVDIERKEAAHEPGEKAQK